MTNGPRDHSKRNGSRGRPSPASSPPRAPRRGFDPESPFQVGRRPSSPLLLLIVGLFWIAAGLVVLFQMQAGWRFVPAVVAVGVGLYFIRGSSATVLRRVRRNTQG
jgi:hypothetical protein